jgi:hypothetical protein
MQQLQLAIYMNKFGMQVIMIGRFLKIVIGLNDRLLVDMIVILDGFEIAVMFVNIVQY